MGGGTACADTCGTPLWAVIAASGGLEGRLASRGEGGRPPRVLAEAPAARSPAAAGPRWGRRGSRPCSLRGAVVGVRARGPRCAAPQNSGQVFFGFRGSRASCWTVALLRALYAAASVLGVQPMPRRGTPGVLCPGRRRGLRLHPRPSPQHTHLAVPTVPTRWRCLTPPSGCPGTRRGKPSARRPIPQGPGSTSSLGSGAGSVGFVHSYQQELVSEQETHP